MSARLRALDDRIMPVNEPMVGAPAGVAAAPRGLRAVPTRMRVRRRRTELDARLAAAEDPWSSAELLLRASQLSALEHRRRLAASLQAMVAVATMGSSASAYLRLRHRAILAHREALLAIAACLRQPSPVSVAAVAQIAILAWDESSPVKVGGRPATEVGERLRRCLETLADC